MNLMVRKNLGVKFKAYTSSTLNTQTDSVSSASSCLILDVFLVYTQHKADGGEMDKFLTEKRKRESEESKVGDFTFQER